MKKHLQNLEILCKKLRHRYGDNDDLVMQLKQELETLTAKKLAKANQSQRKDDKDESPLPLH